MYILYFVGSILKARCSSGTTHRTSPPPAKQNNTAVSADPLRTKLLRPSSKSLRQPLRVKSRPVGASRGPFLSASAEAQRLGGATIQGGRVTAPGLQRKRGATLGAAGETPGKRVARDTSGLQGRRGAVGTGGRTAPHPGGLTVGLGSATEPQARDAASTLQGKRSETAGTPYLPGKQDGVRAPPNLHKKRDGVGGVLDLRGKRVATGAEAEEEEPIRICPVKHKVTSVCKRCMARWVGGFIILLWHQGVLMKQGVLSMKQGTLSL